MTMNGAVLPVLGELVIPEWVNEREWRDFHTIRQRIELYNFYVVYSSVTLITIELK
jgi:hypothetical protein